MSVTINTVCICGAGTMGAGIAQVAAESGLYTILYDLNATVLDKAKLAIDSNLALLISRGKLTAGEKENILQRIQFTNDIYSCLADVFIEAIAEKAAWKIALFNQLAEINHSECIFATNTSSLSVTHIASQVKKPERVAGMHFFNPAPLMRLVEIVSAEQTNASTLQAIGQLATQLGKTAVLCKDAPGFIVNRVARPYYIESLRMAEAGLAAFSQLDSLLEATGFRMGPFKLMDLIGNDINYAVSCSVYDQLGKPERLRPSVIQQKKVANGELGRKSGKGYYEYPAGKK